MSSESMPHRGRFRIRPGAKWLVAAANRGRQFAVTGSIAALLAVAGCSPFTPSNGGLFKNGDSLAPAASATDPGELFRRLREAKTQNSVVVQVAGDPEPFRVLPLPPDGDSVFVSDLLSQTGIQRKLGRVVATVYRATPASPMGLPMEVRFHSKTGDVRPDSDYALRAGDRLRVARAETHFGGWLANLFP